MYVPRVPSYIFYIFLPVGTDLYLQRYVYYVYYVMCTGYNCVNICTTHACYTFSFLHSNTTHMHTSTFYNSSVVNFSLKVFAVLPVIISSVCFVLLFNTVVSPQTNSCCNFRLHSTKPSPHPLHSRCGDDPS